MAGPRCTYEQAIKAAAQVIADTDAYMATLSPEQIADEAWLPGGPTREEIAAKVRQLRAQSARNAA